MQSRQILCVFLTVKKRGGGVGKRHFLGTNRYGTSIIWVVVPIQTNNIVIHTPLHGVVVKKPHYLYSRAAGWHIIIGQANENFHFEKYQVCSRHKLNFFSRYIQPNPTLAV